MKDLVILVADKNMQFALKGALSRPIAMGIRPLSYEFRVHPGRDGGVRKTGPEILALERRVFNHALLILDFEGSGTELLAAPPLEHQLDARLQGHWQDRARAIVIEPELDIWVWGSDNALEAAIGWSESLHIRGWLQQRGFDFDKNGKPARPKEALEDALRKSRLPRSSAIYEHIANRISLHRCADRAFLRLKNQMVTWFPRVSGAVL
jgi:hypothetical protein